MCCTKDLVLIKAAITESEAALAVASGAPQVPQHRARLPTGTGTAWEWSLRCEWRAAAGGLDNHRRDRLRRRFARHGPPHPSQIARAMLTEDTRVR